LTLQCDFLALHNWTVWAEGYSAAESESDRWSPSRNCKQHGEL